MKTTTKPNTSAVSAAPVTTMKRRFKGVVKSDKMDKTIVVTVESVKIHEKYKKRYASRKNYKVHDEKNQYKEGDTVSFVECRPLSKDKRWRVIYS